ncbi:MAG: lipoyl synthase [Verrucomicrobia bacterium]|nr:lipoyl synthase [Verrucomicrobiota bacterium]
MNKLNILPPNPEENLGRFPSWLHRKLPAGGSLHKTGELLKKYGLNTVCEEAKCPNRFECYSKKTATFLALGKECSRNCGFCDIDFSKNPKGPEADEPNRIALSVKELGLKHVVITMVARDDLPDGGAAHIAEIIRQTRQVNPECTIEVLTSDFEGKFSSIDVVLNEHPEIYNYNVETVRRLSPRVRHKATYERTLEILSYIEASGKSLFVKSGIMVGLGETPDEIFKTIDDLHRAGCSIITIGQYLQANRRKLLVKEFVHPDTFKKFEEYGLKIGVKYMHCGPFIRSSYNAAELFEKVSV